LAFLFWTQTDFHYRPKNMCSLQKWLNLTHQKSSSICFFAKSKSLIYTLYSLPFTEEQMAFCNSCKNPLSKCKFNSTTGGFQCVCKDGYVGDGITCAQKLSKSLFQVVSNLFKIWKQLYWRFGKSLTWYCGFI